ncbi:MAG TPA: ELWxxDGT repeat protein [Thermoanaerobaculia bacterium]|nr:ELWxxDGT repeat protein [Thermoanaerobaculia bacterium]
MRARLIAGALLSLVLSAGSGRAAEVPRLLADVNTTPAIPPIYVSEPAGFVAAGGGLLFSTFNQDASDEGVLWRTDGTAEGTRAVSSSLCPSPCQGITPLGTWQGIAILKVVSGEEATQSTRLWRSDSTPEGTFPLTDLLVQGDVEEQLLTPPLGGVFFFTACRQTEGCGLWRSDGTRAGTAVLADGEAPTFDPHAFAFWSGKLYFLAGPGNGTGLWSTDGAPEGTRLLTAVAEQSDRTGLLVATPSHLFFTAGTSSEDVWVTDGTPEGARLLADFESFPCNPLLCNPPSINELIPVGDAVYFMDQRSGHGIEIWRSDGTASGTGPLVEFPADAILGDMLRIEGRWLLEIWSPDAQGFVFWTANDDFSHIELLTGCNGESCPSIEMFLSPPDTVGPRLFIGADTSHGRELWITDGTGGGTHRLSDVCPGPCDAFRPFTSPSVLGSAAGLTYFRAYPSETADGDRGDELWVTDGTAAGTRRIAGHVSALGTLGDLAYFGASDEDRATSEIWATDGTPAGTHRVATIQRHAPSSGPIFLPSPADNALFLAWNGSHEALWQSDGTPRGTLPVAGKELAGNRTLETILPQVGPLRFFTVVRSQGGPHPTALELWRTDGTGSGTRAIADLPTSFLDLPTPWGNRLLFVLNQVHCSFWSSDGTARGTREILSLPKGVRCPAAAVALGGSRFLFVAGVVRKNGPVSQIFVSNGTLARTYQLSDVRGSRRPLAFDQPVVSGGIAFLRIRGTELRDAEIWRSDGTPAGTFQVFAGLHEPANLFAGQGSLYFTASTEQGGPRSLYRAVVQGGGPAVLLAHAAPPYLDPDVLTDLEPTLANGLLLFVAQDADAGSELWATDGTPAGTHRVSDIRPGPGSSSPDGLAAAGSRVFFSADDGEHGRELWESDGTPEGTRMVFDLNPGGFSSNPGGLLVSNGYLFFGADDGTTGFEPWALRLEP